MFGLASWNASTTGVRVGSQAHTVSSTCSPESVLVEAVSLAFGLPVLCGSLPPQALTVSARTDASTVPTRCLIFMSFLSTVKRPGLDWMGRGHSLTLPAARPDCQ